MWRGEIEAFTLCLSHSRETELCRAHLGDATAAILCQNAHHTPAEVERERAVFVSDEIRGRLGGRLREPGLGTSPGHTGGSPCV